MQHQQHWQTSRSAAAMRVGLAVDAGTDNMPTLPAATIIRVGSDEQIEAASPSESAFTALSLDSAEVEEEHDIANMPDHAVAVDVGSVALQGDPHQDVQKHAKPDDGTADGNVIVSSVAVAHPDSTKIDANKLVTEVDDDDVVAKLQAVGALNKESLNLEPVNTIDLNAEMRINRGRELVEADTTSQPSTATQGIAVHNVAALIMSPTQSLELQNLGPSKRRVPVEMHSEPNLGNRRITNDVSKTENDTAVLVKVPVATAIAFAAPMVGAAKIARDAVEHINHSGAASVVESLLETNVSLRAGQKLHGMLLNNLIACFFFYFFRCYSTAGE